MPQTINIMIIINKTLLKINLQNNTYTEVPNSRFKQIIVMFQGIGNLFITNHQQSKNEELKQLFKLAPYAMQFSHGLTTYSQVAARILLPEFELSNSTRFCCFICTTSRLLAIHFGFDYTRHGKITLYIIRRP
jgi:hypothetical protein